MKGVQLYNSFAVLVSGASLFIVIKYIRLIKNKFPHKQKLMLINLLRHGTTLLMANVKASIDHRHSHYNKYVRLYRLIVSQ